MPIRTLVLLLALVNASFVFGADKLEQFVDPDWAAKKIPITADHQKASEHFIFYWGDDRSATPQQDKGKPKLDPDVVLKNLETAYNRIAVESRYWLNEGPFWKCRYKINVYALKSWKDPKHYGADWYAVGFGAPEKVTGHIEGSCPALMNYQVMAHELAHVLQCFNGWNVDPKRTKTPCELGDMWEAHADFMACRTTPALSNRLGSALFMFSQHMQLGYRRPYQHTVWMEFLVEKEGFPFFSDVYTEWSQYGVHPYEGVMQRRKLTPDGLKDYLYEFARRNATWDYQLTCFRKTAQQLLGAGLDARLLTTPELLDAASGDYAVSGALAPQEYGYNVIRLWPKPAANGKASICAKVKGMVQPAGQADWRFGLVAVTKDGTSRSSNPCAPGSTACFPVQPDDQAFFLVVMATPATLSHFKDRPHWTKVARYPYQFRVEGAEPQGYALHRTALKGSQSGSAHANGGGFVASTASVAAEAFVGPEAMVLGNAKVTGTGRIEGHAVVLDQATVSEKAIIRDWAIVRHRASVGGSATVADRAVVCEAASVTGEATVKEDACVRGQARVGEKATVRGGVEIRAKKTFIHGDAVVAGWVTEPFEAMSPDHAGGLDISKGEYYDLEGRSIDGQTKNPLNTDINPQPVRAGAADMKLEHRH